MSWIYEYMMSYYYKNKENRIKRQHFNNQINKYHLNLSQFFSLKRIFNEGEDEDEKEKDDTYDSESTFNKLEHISKLGIKVNNENLWPTIKYMTSKNRRTVNPVN